MLSRLFTGSRLGYPAGRAPGFDSSHIAAQNTLASIITVNSSNAINLTPSFAGGSAVVGTRTGTPTTQMDLTGPMLVPVGANYVQFTVATGTLTQVTLAAIVFINTGVVNSGCFSLGNTTSAAQLAFYTGALFSFDVNTASTSSTLTFPSGYYFAVASYNGINVNFLVTNLLTGAIKTSTVAAASGTVPAATLINYGREPHFGTTWSGRIGAGMISANYMPMPQLREWGANPWSFWYPRKTYPSMDWELVGTVAAFQAAWARNRNFVNQGGVAT